MLLKIRAAKENERGPIYMEPVLSVCHSLEETVFLEVGVVNHKIALYVRGSQSALKLVESQLYAQYPDIEIEHSEEDPLRLAEDEQKELLHLQLGAPEMFPVKRYPQFEDQLTKGNVDPLAGITSALTTVVDPLVRGHIQIAILPLSNSYRKKALKTIPLLGAGMSKRSDTVKNLVLKVRLGRQKKRLLLWPLYFLLAGWRTIPILSSVFLPSTPADPKASATDDAMGARSHDREDSIAGAQDKLNRLLFSCELSLAVLAPVTHKQAAKQQLQEMVGSFRQFTLPHSNAFVAHKKPSQFALSVEEVATLWHLPTILVQTPNIDWVMSKKLEPPANLPRVTATDATGDITTLGAATFRGHRTTFGIKVEDRMRHVYIIGKTGMGKSTLLENMIYSDIQAGKGVAVIDPHGDLIENSLQFVPSHRNNDVILFDPSDVKYPISFNVLDCSDPEQYSVTASGIMSVFKKLWPDAFSGRMEHILRNALLALLEFEGSSMLGIMRIFADDAFRAKVVERVTNPMVESFWNDEYANWSEKYRTEAIAAIQNKVGQLLSTPMIRNIVGQSKSKLNIRQAMDSGKIILVNLSKGKIGEDTAAFLGSMLVTKFQLDAMSRADIPGKDRKDFFLYVDEFQNFATESFATILSEARKYRLSLTMANQYVSQLMIGDNNSALRDAVFGNVGTLISFQVGSEDAEVLSLQFEEYVLPKDILSLPKYHAYMRVMIDGVSSKPFSVNPLPPPMVAQVDDRKSILQHLTREQYSQHRDTVEEKIRAWSKSASAGKQNAKQFQKDKEKEEEELKKARKKGMSLEQYRAWRDTEMWQNDFNALRKRHLLEQNLTPEEQKTMNTLATTLQKQNALPPISKGLQQLIDEKNGIKQ